MKRVIYSTCRGGQKKRSGSCAYLFIVHARMHVSPPIRGYAAEPSNTAGGGGAARYVVRDPNPSLREELVEVPWNGSRT